MQLVLSVFIFIFGTIIGSFLNVVICRHGTGRGLGGRSKCAVTGKTLEWYELVPVLSFAALGGRSRYSKTKISWQYPLVEFGTGLSFLLIFHHVRDLLLTAPDVLFVTLLFYFAVASFFILIFVYDLRHKLIPDAFLYPLAALAFTGLLFGAPMLDCLRFPGWWGLLSGPLLALPLFLLWFFTRGRGMGFGDVLLMIPIGWLLGYQKGFAALLLAFWVGAVVGLVLMLVSGKRLKSEIAFGPFLIVGFALAFLYNIDMQAIGQFFSHLIS